MPTAGAWWDDQSPCTRSLSEQAAKRLKDGSFEICRWERVGIIGPIRTQPKRTTYALALKRGQMLRVWRQPQPALLYAQHLVPPSDLQLSRNLYRLYKFREPLKLSWPPAEPPTPDLSHQRLRSRPGCPTPLGLSWMRRPSSLTAAGPTSFARRSSITSTTSRTCAAAWQP